MEPQTAERYMQGAMLMALADGVLDPQEKHLLRKLQRRLGLSDEQLRQLVADLRAKRPVEALFPQTPDHRRAAFELMVAVARADGQISPEERELLGKVARHLDLDEATVQEVLGTGPEVAQATAAEAQPATSGPADQTRREIVELIGQFYRHMKDWPDARQRAERFLEYGQEAVIPLIRAFESYRCPDGLPDACAWKTIVAELLGRLGDTRAVYYLAELLRFGDEDNELTNQELREATAEAIGRLTGKAFPRSPEGVRAARQWWFQEGMDKYPLSLV